MKPSDASERTIFDTARQLPEPAARAAYLAAACAGDPNLRERVEKLLAANQRADEFLAGDPLGLGKAGLRPTSGAPLSEGPGTIIDKYKLLERLGEGGFGVVYMAEQAQPVKRRVALKIIKVGMDTREVVGRFEAERQALAMMDHPNIAKVFDGGATDTGRPYFVMELVRGMKITDYCDEKSLPTGARLDLFTQVCQAVQHAHQKGIIHRDLKPSNILVTINDGAAVPKIIDFGIAKATQIELTDETVFTRFQQFLGTPAYMSPEQAQLSSVDIDTRSDIYSLGVLLYELLTGKTPFDSKELLQAGLDEMRRTIREKEPPTPSTRVSTMHGDELTTTAKRRGLEPPKLISLLRGDLDWIVMKCLEKDRGRRYETANGLAMDIQRHLNNEPVVASPPGTAYRLGKFVRRNRGAVLAGGVVALALVFAAVLSMWEARQQSRLRQQAQTEKAKAQTEAAKSEQVTQFLQDMLAGVGPSKAKGRDTTMLKEILDKTAERIGKELTNAPDVELEVRTALAATYEELGLYAQVEEMARCCLELARAQSAEENRITARAFQQLGDAQFQLGKYEEAEATFRHSLELRRKLLGNEHPVLGVSYNALAVVLRFRGKLKEAEDAQREALRLCKRHDPENVGPVLLNLTEVLRLEGKLADAETTGSEAVAVLRKSGQLPALATALHNLALVMKSEGNQVGAEALDSEALEIRRRVLVPQHPSMAESLVDLAEDLTERGDGAGAESAARESLAIRRKALGSEHVLVAASLYWLGEALDVENKLPEAEDAFRQAVEVGRKALGSEDQYVGRLLDGLAQTLRREEKLSEAESLQREALAIARKAGREHPVTGKSLNSLATILVAQGKFTEAESASSESVTILEKVHGPEHPALASALSTLAMVLQYQVRLSEAEAAAVKALDMRRRFFGSKHRYTAASLDRLGSILTDEGKLPGGEGLYRDALVAVSAQGSDAAIFLGDLAVNLRYQDRLAEAVTTARTALTENQRVWGRGHPTEIGALNALAEVLQQEGRPAEADQLYREEMPAIRAGLAENGLPLASALAQWTEVLIEQGKYAQAEPLARQCLEIRERKVPGDFATFSAQTILGAALLGEMKYDEAESLLVSGYQELALCKASIRPDGRLRLRKALQSLKQFYDATGRPNQAAEWKKKLVEFEQAQTNSLPAPPPSAKPPL